jgi:hypothetical protein
MNAGLIRIIIALRNRNVIGHKHFPERLAIVSKIKRLPKQEQKEILAQYNELVNKGYFWRLMKKTGKGSEWHVSINPEMLKEIEELIGDDDEVSNWEIL